jgi:two-component system nitrogen regulation response regulator NtrX
VSYAEAVRLALPATSSSGEAAGRDRKAAEKTGTLAERVLEFERAEVLAELERSGKHVTPAAKALGLERSHLYKKCQQLGIDLQSLRSSE